MVWAGILFSKKCTARRSNQWVGTEQKMEDSMMLMNTKRMATAGLCMVLGAASCGAAPSGDLTSTEQAVIGSNIPGVQASAGLLAEARTAFGNVEGLTDGLGPIFNERGCGNCHQVGALGGAGENTERRFGRFVNGFFDPLASLGGSLHQLFTVGRFNNPNLPAGSRGACDPRNPTLCCPPLEVEPPQATVHNVGRVTTPLFGLGLVDAIPDSFFDGIAAAQPATIRGVVNRVPVFLPNPGDPSQTINSTRVGRFGWKSGIANLMQFAADAYNNEMGISTQHCFRGTSIINFANENAPNALAVPSANVPDGCDDLAPRQTPALAAAIGLPGAQGQMVDDVVGDCAMPAGRTEIQDDVFLFTAFMTALAPPPRDLSDQASIARGEPLFTQVGCAGCHVTTTFRTPANPSPVDIGNGQEFVRVPGNFAFNPFSDFLKHDMGTLGDMIGQAPPDDPAQGLGDTIATTRQMRTAPLWGIRFRNKLLHDGRTTDVTAAIRAHDGQAAAARNAFNALSSANQHNLTQFVRSL
jgi:CxxC motif-containing protein (DUF1111 family)